MKNILLILFLILFFGSRYIYYNYSIYREYFNKNIDDHDIDKTQCYKKCKTNFDFCKVNSREPKKCVTKYNNCYSKTCGFFPKQQIYKGDYRGSKILGNNFKMSKCCK